MPTYGKSYGYGRRSYRKRSSSFTSSGQVYKTGSSTYEIRRHSIERTIEIEPQKAKIIPLLAYFDTEGASVNVNASSKITSQGTKVYPTIAVEKGSRVNAIKLDVMIEPKTGNSSQITPFYVSRCVTSFHDVKGGDIYGLEPDADTGKIKFCDEAASPTNTDVITGSGSTNAAPELAITKAQYDVGDTIKHWWKGTSKNIMFGGQPVSYVRTEPTPKKAKRSNEGMFYGMMIMNDGQAIAGDTDTLRVTIKQSFNEIPLIQ